MYNERIKEAQKEIENIINAGAPIVKLDIFRILDNYVPSEKVKNQWGDFGLPYFFVSCT